MIFVTADRNKTRLEKLTELLAEVFPGSTIYQNVNPPCVPAKAESSVLGRSQTERLRDTAVNAGAVGYFLPSMSGQALKEAVLSKDRERCV